MKTLQEIIARLAAIDVEVRAAKTTEEIDKLETEKRELLTRKGELEDLETRKQTALNITAGTTQGNIITRSPAFIKSDFKGMSPEEVRGTEEYRSAFLKSLIGRKLTDLETRANEMATTDAAGVIPTITANQIFSLLKQDAPILSEVSLFNIPGNLTIGVEGTNADAALHTQNAAISPAADTMSYVTLGGFEIVKVNRLSATLSSWAISAFEAWLTANISKKLARKMAYYIFYGTGSSMPKGIDYMDTWSDTANAVDFASTYPTPAEILELYSYLGGGYQTGAKVAMNNTTLYGHIAIGQDNAKYKILSDDYKYLLGKEIILDDNVITGDIFYGNFREGMIANVSSPITVLSSRESGFLNNSIDFRGACLFDCDMPSTVAFVKGAATLTAGA
jgi:HK97 family phage major capsid protein